MSGKDEPEDWTREERARLDALDAQDAPGGAGLTPERSLELERRVVSALRERGEIVPPAGRARRIAGPWRAAAAALVLFVAGLGVGRLTAPGGEAPPAPPPGTERRFALLLTPGPGPAPEVPEADLVREYGAWAGSLSERGHQVSGEKLKSGERRLPGASPGDAPGTAPALAGMAELEGFFILSAPSMEEAEALARTCPHLKYGGVVTVREIDPT